MDLQISTIKVSDLIPEATRAIERYTRRSDPSITLQRYDTHLSTEDLVMETVEKVVKANPQYLTKTYVWLAAKSVCINRCQKKRLDTVEVLPAFYHEDTVVTPIEEELLGDAYDHITDHLEDLLKILNHDEQTLLEALLDGLMYVEIAENLGVSLRTLERRVQELKLKIETFLLP